MSKQSRQYLGLLCAVCAYYLIHEGAHLLYAVTAGVFKQINIIGLGVQIDIYADKLTSTQLGIFCLAGAAATQLTAYSMALSANSVCRSPSKLFKACSYYVTLALLLADPLYLSVLCGAVGGGDMNGISLLIPETFARLGFGALLIVNAFVFWKRVLPHYTAAFREDSV